MDDTNNFGSGLRNQLYDGEDYSQDGPPTDSATGEARSLRETELDNELSALTLDDAREYDKRARRNLVDLESEMIALQELNRQQAEELKKLKRMRQTESLRFEKEIRRRLDREDAMNDRIYDDADDDSDGSNNEQTLRCVPDKRGEKMIQNYKWPKLASVEFEGWRRLVFDQVASAKRSGINNNIINNSLKQHLMNEENIVNDFCRLTQTINTATLRGTIKLINTMNNDNNIYSPEERFSGLKLRRGESAAKYLGRLQCQFRDLFGTNAAGETRRIKQQFIDGFVLDGQTLEPEDKKICQAYANLTEMAIFAEEQMSRKTTQLSTMKNSYAGENINPDGTKGMDNPKYCPIDMMDQAPHMQHQLIPPPPPFPAQPILPSRCPGFENQKHRRPPLISAGPCADRVSLGEWSNGIASDGCFFCNRCLIKGHTSLDCPFFTACAKCADPPAEMGHSTKYHKRYWQRMHQQGGHHAPCAKTCPGPLQNHPIVPSSHAVYQQTDGQSNL